MGFLAEQPRSGYDLKNRCFDEQAGAFWTADQAQIYRTLERLQSSRMVTSARKRQIGKPDRRVYSLTPTGAAALASWLANEPPPAAPRDAFLLQVFFSEGLSDSTILGNLSARRDTHQAHLEALRHELITHTELAAQTPRAKLLRGAAYDGAIARERALIDWLDDTIEAIRGGHLPAAEYGGSSRSDRMPEMGSA